MHVTYDILPAGLNFWKSNHRLRQMIDILFDK